jgi:tellurite resistance protein TerC
VSFREAATWSAVWVSLALAFNYGLYHFALWKFAQDPRLLAIPGFDAATAAKETALEFLTGFIVEKSLSVDNIFVFVLIFNFFALPARYQHRVLFFGILGALVFRAIFIVLGSALLQFHWVVWIFGLFLIASGLKIMLAPEKGIDPEKNPIIRLFRRFVPVTPALHGQRFFVRLNGILHATPLFVTLLFVEVTDIIFAVDSVPAIYALTGEPLVVFVSNVFAILGLRALYFLLAGMMDRFYMLKYGLAVVLIFVGLKIAWLNGLYGGKFPITISLGFIAAVIVLSVVASLVFPRHASLPGTLPAPRPKA